TVLPNGLPNPNLGRPFANSRGNNWQLAQNRSQSVRATAFLKYDFKDMSKFWGKWLGHHTVTGLYQRDRADAIATNPYLMDDGPAANFVNPFINLRGSSEVVYMGPSLIGNNNPLRLSAIDVQPDFTGAQGVPLSAFRREGNATDPGA